MEQVFSVVENSGNDVHETFTIRINISKAKLLEHLPKSGGYVHGRYPNIGSISFNHGLLKDVPNSFDLKILPDFSGVEVYYPSHLSKKHFGLHVSEMTFSLQTDGVTQFMAQLHPSLLKKTAIQPNGHTACFQMGTNSSASSQWYFDIPRKITPKLNASSWPESANELKIDIKISNPEQTKFVEVTSGLLPVLLETNNSGICVSKYFLSDKMSDIAILCNNEAFPAHKFILSHNSPVFEKMFETEMKESKESIVNIKNTEPAIVLEMLRFFYSGKAEILDTTTALKLYSLADIYMVDNLKSICVRSLLHCVNTENALEMYCFAKKNEIPLLSQKAERVMVASRKEIIKNLDDLQALMNAVPAPIAAELFQLFLN